MGRFVPVCSSQRNNSAVARRLIGGLANSSRGDGVHGMERVVHTQCLRSGCAGSIVLRYCLGAVTVKRNACNIRITTGCCFSGSMGRLALIRYTTLTTVAGDPAGCTPSAGPRGGGRHHGAILHLVGRRNCVSSSRCGRTGGARLGIAIGGGTATGSSVGSCFVSTLVDSISTSLTRGCKCSGTRTRHLFCGNNCGVCTAISARVRTVTRGTCMGVTSSTGGDDGNSPL